MHSVAILIVGDEILSGEIDDENGPFLLRALTESGVEVVRVVVVPDLREAIVEELRRLRALADAVVISGGIGPTHDDVTRPAVAEALGVDLERNPEAVRRVEGFYADGATEAELSMSLVPRGARLVLGEKTGTFGFEAGGIYALPGVPFLFRDIAVGLPRAFSGRPLHRTELRTHRREGEIAASLARAQGRAQDVAIGSYPVFEGDGWYVRVVMRSADPARLAEVVREVREAIA